MLRLLEDGLRAGLKSLWAAWYQPEEELQKIIPELNRFVEELRELAKNPDRLSALVDFMKLVSDWQGRDDLGRIQLLFEKAQAFDDERLDCLEALKMRLRLLGRGEGEVYDGRMIGEPYSHTKVFIGGEYGLNYLSVAEWKLLVDEPALPTSHMHMEGKRPYTVVSEQARRFMERNFLIIRDHVERLQRRHPSDRLKEADARATVAA